MPQGESLNEEPKFHYRIRGLVLEVHAIGQRSLVRVSVHGKVTSWSEDPRYAQSYPCESMAHEIPFYEDDTIAYLDRYLDMLKIHFREFLEKNKPIPLFKGGPLARE